MEIDDIKIHSHVIGIGGSGQSRLDSESIDQIRRSLECRDEIIPILKTVQHLGEQTRQSP